MPVKKTPLEQAQAIVGMDPLPDDAEAQIEALEAEADENEKPLFEMIYEGLFVAENS